MGITWTKEWQGADDGTVLRAVDLRNIQLDLANVLQTSDIGVSAQAYDADLLNLASPENINPANWIRNGAFDAFTGSDPDNWTIAGSGTNAQETTIVQIGANSYKITSDADGCTSTQTIIATISSSTNSYYRSKKVTFTCLVYATDVSNARIRVTDGVATTNSSYHTGTTGWEELSVTHTIDSSATSLSVVLCVDGNVKVAYFSGARLNLGGSKWAFTRHKGDSTNP